MPLDKLKSTNVIRDEGGTRDVYEEPDQLKIRVTAAAQPKNFELTKCPAYVSTRNDALSQPTQISDYECVTDSVNPC